MITELSFLGVRNPFRILDYSYRTIPHIFFSIFSVYLNCQTVVFPINLISHTFINTNRPLRKSMYNINFLIAHLCYFCMSTLPSHPVHPAKLGWKITGHPAERSGPPKARAVLVRLALPSSSLSSRPRSGKDTLPQTHGLNHQRVTMMKQVVCGYWNRKQMIRLFRKEMWRSDNMQRETWLKSMELSNKLSSRAIERNRKQKLGHFLLLTYPLVHSNNLDVISRNVLIYLI